jgi:hypothetical protein
MPSSSSFSTVSVLSKDNAWFVGPGSFAHWDGKSLEMLPGPNVEADEVFINDAAFRSADDGWAVGAYAQEGESNRQSHLLSLHWDGNAWTSIPTPSLPSTSVGPYSENKGATLEAVTIISENDVWAVGSAPQEGTVKTLVLHWDGTKWEVVPSPNVGNSDNYLTSVVSLSESNVWAFGFRKVGVEAWENEALSLHWDGTSWKVIDSPTTLAEISAASVSSSSGIWVVSVADNVMNPPPNGTSVLGSAIRESGDGWKEIPMPDIDDPILRSVVAASADDVWAVGSTGGKALVMHWDGKAWSEIPPPNPAGLQHLVDVGAAAKDDIWAVGWSSEDEGEPVRQMLVHFVGCSSSTR